MNGSANTRITKHSAAFIGLTLLARICANAQVKPPVERIQAQAVGQMRAAGRTFNVTITIESYSNPEDQHSLIDAFTRGGHNALVAVLSNMKSRGRVALTGTLGYGIDYVRSYPTENGRRIRLITNRPIRFSESYNAVRSTDYDLSAIELNLRNDMSKSDGSLVIAARFKTEKDQQFDIESFGSGPWRLVNIKESGKRTGNGD